jgi:arsenate reductase (glutaredoxin)
VPKGPITTRHCPEETSQTAGMAAGDDPVTVYFNPSCSKCQVSRRLLEDRGVEANYVRYLDEAPDRAELERVMTLLGISDPRAMMRTSDSRYAELGLATADREELLDAMVANPILIERPIVIRGERAVIARPPERLLDLLDG